jgi:hypothetical protein
MAWSIILIIITTAIGLLTWLIKNKTKGIKIVVSILLIIALTGQIINLRTETLRKMSESYSGVIKGGSISLLSPSNQIYPRLRLGNSQTFIDWQGPQEKPIFKFFDDNQVTIWIENNQIKISTQIRDMIGNLIAEIRSNEWLLNKDIWDRNYNNKALEVKNSQGDIILQVQLKEYYVQFAAKMYGKDGQAVGIGSSVFSQDDIEKHNNSELFILGYADEEVHVGDTVGTIELRPKGIPLQLQINPIFQYPSKYHFGELIENK